MRGSDNVALETAFTAASAAEVPVHATNACASRKMGERKYRASLPIHTTRRLLWRLLPVLLAARRLLVGSMIDGTTCHHDRVSTPIPTSVASSRLPVCTSLVSCYVKPSAGVGARGFIELSRLALHTDTRRRVSGIVPFSPLRASRGPGLRLPIP